MKLIDYKTDFAAKKGYDSWEELAGKYHKNGWVPQLEVILGKITEKYAEDKLREYKIAQLPPQQRRIFDVVKWGWQSSGEISALCGKPSENIGRQLEILEDKGLICSKLELTTDRKTTKFWRLKRNPDADE